MARRTLEFSIPVFLLKRSMESGNKILADWGVARESSGGERRVWVLG